MKIGLEMKAHNYLFRITCLELYYPIIVNDKIYIIPNADNIKDTIESNFRLYWRKHKYT